MKINDIIVIFPIHLEELVVYAPILSSLIVRSIGKSQFSVLSLTKCRWKEQDSLKHMIID